jgi:hypothetical protein
MTQTHVNPGTTNPEVPEPVQPQRELTPGQQPEPEVPDRSDSPTIVPDPQIPEINPGTPGIEVPPLQ